MEVRLHRDPASFAALARPLYAADPVTHTVGLTILARPAEYRTLLTVHADGLLIGAALRNPLRPLVASALPETVAGDAVAALVGHDPELDGVMGPRPRAEAFAAAWCVATGARARTAVAQRLFRLGALAAPTGTNGAPRVAADGDLDLVWRWRAAFVVEASPHAPPLSREEVRDRMRDGGGATVLWEVAGEPVALAGVSTPAVGMSRVGPVYTPPELRGHGYGSAVTAAASRWALDAGARDVVLFTDLANPVSNAIYPRIGYRPVEDTVHLTLEPA